MHSRLTHPLLLIVFVSFLFNSCTSYKEVPLFRDLPQDSELKEKIANYDPLIIQPNDILRITVSSLNPEASALFNNPSGTAQQNTSTQVDPAANGFVVNPDGDIHIPYIGKIKVGSLSTIDATEKIRERLEVHLKEPVVNLRVANFKVAVFGGVNRAGIFPITNERVTLVEALIMAGDLRLTSRRHNVLLVREIDGERKFARFDLGSKSTFNSEYFYLKNNDLIYIQPGTSEEQTITVLAGVGALSTVVSLILILTQL
jgi:polysaccharide export outer membrane protein